MKNLIQYVYSCTEAMHQYLKDTDLDKLIERLSTIETHAKAKIGGKDCTLWFKFGYDDTLATDIYDIKRDLKGINRGFTIERMQRVSKDLNPQNELKVFFS